jgi:hypothetical protein
MANREKGDLDKAIADFTKAIGLGKNRAGCVVAEVEGARGVAGVRQKGDTPQVLRRGAVFRTVSQEIVILTPASPCAVYRLRCTIQAP